MRRLPRLDIALNCNNSPHVVILGAGASLAALPRGDRHGRRLPVMRNLVEVLNLQDLFERHQMRWKGLNFEDVYDAISDDTSKAALRTELERRVWSYFTAIEIPESVTLYDELLLSLRGKDIIATFNWDPLLLQAYRRVADLGDMPSIVFLHGNVGIGYCEANKIKGAAGQRCSKCGKVLTPSPLLFPVRDKRYREHPFLAGEWAVLEAHLQDAFIMTIFGYSAPATDVNARDLLLKAWTANATRELAQIEIVDIRPRRDLEASWGDFIVRQHYGIARRLSNTYSFHHPRRSCDALAGAILQLDPWSENKLRRYRNLSSLRRAIAPLITEEILLREQRRPFTSGASTRSPAD